MGFVLTEEDAAAMAGMEKQMMEEMTKESQRQQDVLAAIKEVVKPEVYDEIITEIQSDGYTFDFKIADAPIGTEQDDGASWGKHFVNQTTNGGFTGDEYAGTVSIPLGDGRFFQFSYTM